MKREALTAEVVRQLLDYDPSTGVFRWKARGPEWFPTPRRVNSWNGRHAGQIAAYQSPRGYQHIQIFKVRHAAHRLAWLFAHGAWPKGEIDHINHVRNDNRIGNLRDVPSGGNQRNRRLRCNNTSGHAGITKPKGCRKWLVRIGSGVEQRRHIGYFETLEEAIAARQCAMQQHGYHENHGKRS